MNPYKNIFKKALISEEEDSQNRSQLLANDFDGDTFSDEDAWNDANPDINDDDELLSSFNVEELGRNEIEKYSEIINKWGNGIEEAIKQLAQIIKFAAGEKLQGAPGSEQFTSLIRDAPRLKKDLSAFKSQVEDLEETVKLAINDDAIARREKIRTL